MEEIDLKKLTKQIDDYFDNLTEEQFMEDMKRINEEIEKNTILDELENGNNIVVPIKKRKKKKPGNKKFNNQGMRRRG
jgi:hypothetical protein